LCAAAQARAALNKIRLYFTALRACNEAARCIMYVMLDTSCALCFNTVRQRNNLARTT
jgi:hypothetical protein